jgi:uncharacterized membrane protein YhaH (DUF805 family)
MAGVTRLVWPARLLLKERSAMPSSNPYQSPQTDVTAPPLDGVDQTGPFDPKGRFGRLSYIAWALAASFVVNIVQVVVMMLIGVGVGVGVGVGDSPDSTTAVGGVGMVLTFVFALAAMVVTIIFFIRRLHDIDLSGWWTLLMLVPLVNFFFGLYALIKPGTPGANRFGPPRETRGWEQVVGIIGVVLMVLSLVVLIGLLVVVLANPELMQQWSQTM